MKDRTASPLATRFDSEGDPQVLFADGTVWSQRRGVPCRRSALLFLDRSPLGAAPIDDGWAVVFDDSPSPTLSAISDYGRHLWSVSLGTILGDDPSRRDVALAPAEGYITVARMNPPYTWALVDSAGGVLLRGSPQIGVRPDSLIAIAMRDHWNAFAVLPVRNGFVQTIESPDANSGLFVLYDILGKPVRVMRRFAASVLVASYPELRMLVGYQYKSPGGGRGTLYLYRY